MYSRAGQLPSLGGSRCGCDGGGNVAATRVGGRLNGHVGVADSSPVQYVLVPSGGGGSRSMPGSSGGTTNDGGAVATGGGAAAAAPPVVVVSAAVAAAGIRTSRPHKLT
mmetsp:Transcript_39766/g.97468  ORF Transcript_39766/g.97468 Transcript_39766/m.97468 type:complete len:109 (-) Transcript_39766:620-946(-)